jgi:ATP synthase subunit 6
MLSHVKSCDFITSPLTQFEIISLANISGAGVDISFTNAALMMLLAVTFGTIFYQTQVAEGSGTIIPSRWGILGQGTYTMAYGMVDENTGKEGQVFFPFVFSIFMFVLLCNVLGLVPYSFTVTSHLIVTITLAGMIFLGKLIIGFRRHGLEFFALLLPGGAPMVMAPFLVRIELVSFNITIVSLSVRLFANMMAGHILLKVLAGFAWTMMLGGTALFIAHFLPLGVRFALYGLETGVAIVQAYVFSLLTCIYLNEVMEGAH